MAKKKIVTIIGARPQIIKASALSRAIKHNFSSEIEEIIVHTGQHYDANMSAYFFEELQIPTPLYNLQVGSSSHAKQTATMIEKLEHILIKEKPNAIVLYGDTNSTLAGTIVASKLNIPIVHIEAGLRSFKKTMPEEINRILCDHTATLLFTPTHTGYHNLIHEGFSKKASLPYTPDNPAVFHSGDIMYDNSLYFSAISKQKSKILHNLRLQTKDYVLATLHRPQNTDTPKNLQNILEALFEISTTATVVLPLHPRTKAKMQEHLAQKWLAKLKDNQRLKIIEPVSFLDMIALEKNSKLIITDSGGVQKEAYFFKKKCIVLRNETEWVEMVELEVASLVGANKQKIIQAYQNNMNTHYPNVPNLFGNGKTAYFIAQKILEL